MAILKCAILLYSIYAWLLLIPATILIIGSINTNRCLKQNYSNITYVHMCLEDGYDWTSATVISTIIFIMHNAVITLMYTAGGSNFNFNFNCIKHNSNSQNHNDMLGTSNNPIVLSTGYP